MRLTFAITAAVTVLALSTGATFAQSTRPSTVELGKRAFDMKVECAVNQIRQLLGAK